MKVLIMAWQGKNIHATGQAVGSHSYDHYLLGKAMLTIWFMKSCHH